jgi:uncharacterized membrane protein
MDLPPIPQPEGAHPIVVHFPIALLLFAPALVVLALLVPKLRRGVALAALAVMAAGATGTVAATLTGEEAADHAEKTAAGEAARDLLREHEEAGERARNAALVLVALYGVLQIVPVVRKREFDRKTDLVLHGVFLLLYGVGGLLLSHAAHLGGTLVHGRGVHAPLAAPDPEDTPARGDDGGGRGRGRGGR